MDNIENESFLLPVTALVFCQLDRLLLFAGEGQCLKVFDHERRALLHKEYVFESEAIHGIACQSLSRVYEDQALLLIWGGRSLCVVGINSGTCKDGNLQIKAEYHVPEIQLDDWILDGCHRDLDQYAHFDTLIVAAHNQVHLLAFQIANPEESEINHTVSHVASGPRSILYSAHVIWPSSGRILVAAGTAFGEVLLWSIDHDISSSQVSVCLHHVFIGHQGSVFGVRISEPLHDEKRLLASCSDDRTIRVWDVDLEGTASSPPHSGAAGPNFSVREDESLGDDRETNSNRSLAMVVGHASRIWGLHFLSKAKNIWQLMSHGEDGTTQIWRLSFKDGSPVCADLGFELRHETTFGCHFGKNVWAVAVQLLPGGACIVASGGADGRITNINPALQDHNCASVEAWSCQYAMEDVSALVEEADGDKLEPSVNAAQTSMKDIFDSLQGRWRLSRNIDSKLPSHPSGKFEGTARFEPRSPSDEAFAAEYVYSENGDFVTDTGLVMKASRQYVYRYSEGSDTVSVWFVNIDDPPAVDYLFHTLDFPGPDQNNYEYSNRGSQTLIATGYHLCNEDGYNPEYCFQMKEHNIVQWNLNFLVIGPKKDYTTKAIYTRNRPEVASSEDFTKGESASAVMRNGLKDVDETSVLKSLPDAFKTYSWISDTEFLVSTQAGTVMIGTITSKQKIELHVSVCWEFVSHQSLLKASCIATSLSLQGIAFLTGLDGTIFLYHHDRKSVHSLYNLPKKAGFLKAQGLSNSWSKVSQGVDRANNVSVFATCLGSSEATILFFAADERSSALSLLEELHLTLPADFIVTSSCFTEKEQMVILGSRTGNIAVYDLSRNISNLAICIKPKNFHHLHGQEAITVIELVAADPHFIDSTFIVTAGRDGNFAIHQISSNASHSSNPLVSLQTIHTGAPPFGPNIEGACIDSQNLYLWGFRSKEFVVWNESQKTEVMTVDCGGAHRNWAYHHHRDGSGGGQFVYTKASLCHLHAQTKAFQQVFQHGGHGREIKAMALSTPMVNGNERQSRRCLATGAEDTAIRMFGIDSDDEGKCLSVLTKHTTGLQKLQWSPDGRYLFSAAGCEEFFVWSIQPAPLVAIGVVCEAKCSLVTEEGDLRIMDFALFAIESTSTEKQDSKHEPDYLLSMVYSDSSLRIFRYQPHIKAFALLAKGTYTTYCLTQASYLHSAGTLRLCTGSTDGHLAIWPLPFSSTHNKKNNQLLTSSLNFQPPATPFTLTPSLRLHIHQNSIKALISIPLSPSETLIITAGDDGAIALTRLPHSSLTRNPPPPLDTKMVLLIPKAHASAVTALAHLAPDTTNHNYGDDDATIGRFRFTSVGNDQRLKTWRVGIDLSRDGVSGVNIVKERNMHTAVAAASALAVSINDEHVDSEKGGERGRRLYVAGIGLQCWKIGSDGLE